MLQFNFILREKKRRERREREREEREREREREKREREERESGAMPGLAEAQWPEACAQFQSAWKRLAGEVSSSEDEDDRRRRQKCWERRVAGSKLVSPESKSYLVLEHIPFRGRSLKKKEKEKEKEKSDQLWEEEEEESGTEVFLKRQDESECVHLYDFHICYNGW